MYTVRQNAVWIGETCVCVVFDEFTPEMIANALNKDAYTHTYKAAPQFQPWDIAKIKDAAASRYSREYAGCLWLVRARSDNERSRSYADHTPLFEPNIDVRVVLPTMDLELVERLADRKAQG